MKEPRTDLMSRVTTPSAIRKVNEADAKAMEKILRQSPEMINMAKQVQLPYDCPLDDADASMTYRTIVKSQLYTRRKDNPSAVACDICMFNPGNCRTEQRD